jgi:hypothetical protein
MSDASVLRFAPRGAVLLALAAAAAASSPSAMSGAATPKAPPPVNVPRTEAQWTEDGLRKVEVPGLDLVYAREGASLAGYQKVLLRPVQVAFRRDWGRDPQAGTRIRSEDSQQIKSELARIIREETLAELAKGGYALADAPGEGVLEVGVSIADLYLNAPDLPSASHVTYYTMSVGEMTLIAELRDAPTGDLIARVLDRKADREHIDLRITTSVDNVAAARDAARSWARILRAQLDSARKIGAR